MRKFNSSSPSPLIQRSKGNCRKDSMSHLTHFPFSKKMKININQPIKAVERQETDSVNQSIEEDRKMVIQVGSISVRMYAVAPNPFQAAIVRIMKMRKKLSHTPLIDEVIQQLSSRFQPKIPLIKVGFLICHGAMFHMRIFASEMHRSVDRKRIFGTRYET